MLASKAPAQPKSGYCRVGGGGGGGGGGAKLAGAPAAATGPLNGDSDRAVVGAGTDAFDESDEAKVDASSAEI